MLANPKDGLLSVVVPAFNEEANLRAAVDCIRTAAAALGLRIEILVVNDASTDNTGALAADLAAAHPEVKVITHPTNRGLGGAFWSGVDAAQGDFVVMLPGDNENDPAEIMQYLDLMRYADVVIPYVFNKDVRTPMRNRISYVYQALINLSFAVAFNYANGTNIYRRELLAAVQPRSNGFFFQTDALIRLCKAGAMFVEVPYRIRRREGGTSKALSVKSLARVTRDYVLLMADIHLARKRLIREVWDPEKSVTAQRYPEGRRR